MSIEQEATINRLFAENKDLHEQVAALESREVCTMPHENIEDYGCAYCFIEQLIAGFPESK